MAIRAILAMAALYLAPVAGFAQNTSGHVTGTMRDLDHGAIAGADVTIRHEQSGVQVVARTGDDGRFDFPSLRPGTYDLLARHPNFAPLELTNILVNIGAHLTYDLTLQPGSVHDEISVLATLPLVDTSHAEVGGVVEQVQIETLPIAARQYLALALVLPGTGLDATRAFFSSVNAGSSTTFNSTANMVDGATNSWAEDGEPRQDFLPTRSRNSASETRNTERSSGSPPAASCRS